MILTLNEKCLDNRRFDGSAPMYNTWHAIEDICFFHQNPVQFFFVIPRGVPLPHSNVITILRQAQEM